MARKLRIQYEGAIYHVTFRGNAQQAIFGDDRDRERLTGRLGASAEDFGVRVYGYCWMGNHGHLLLETPAANVSAFMASVLTGYTVYYNLRHETSGHVMQGRFGSTVVSGDAYLLRLSRYIHLNPVAMRGWKERPFSERRDALRAYERKGLPQRNWAWSPDRRSAIWYAKSRPAAALNRTRRRSYALSHMRRCQGDRGLQGGSV